MVYNEGVTMKPLSLWLIQQRKLSKLSKSELAQRLNKPISYVHEVEQSRHTLELVEFVKYCHALDADPNIALEIIQNELSGNTCKEEMLLSKDEDFD